MAKPEEKEAPKAKKLTGEKRIDALVIALKNVHGFIIPEEVLPEDEKE